MKDRSFKEEIQIYLSISKEFIYCFRSLNLYQKNIAALCFQFQQFRLNMIKPIKSQKIIMYSKSISCFPNSLEQRELIPLTEAQQIYPRVFPTTRIPLKVAITRKIKIYEDYDLNEALKSIQWKFGRGMLDLKYFNFEVSTTIEECNSQKISKGLVRGRAFDSTDNTFKKFLITEINSINQDYYLKGHFEERPDSLIELNKFYVCLSFENPEEYTKTVIKAVQVRKSFIIWAKYNFYIDNLDLMQAADMPKYLLNDITHKIGVSFLGRDQYLQLNDHFKRTMNQILFTTEVFRDPSICPFPIPKKERKYNSYKPKDRVLTLMKDNKKFRLVLKSLQKKTQQLELKNIFFKDQIVWLMHAIKGKLQQVNAKEIFDLKDQLHVIDRFVADNLLMVGYFTHFIETHIITFIAEIIRKALLEHPDGWFKIYETDKNTYLMSKLRRLLILVQQNIKSTIKERIKSEINRFSQTFKKRLPVSISFQSFSCYGLTYEHTPLIDLEYPPIIALNISITNSNIELVLKRKVLQKMFFENIASVLNKLKTIETPQSKSLIEIFAIFKNEGDIDIQIPAFLNNSTSISPSAGQIHVNSLQYNWIEGDLYQLQDVIQKVIETLAYIEEQLIKISHSLNLSQIIHQSISISSSIKDIIDQIGNYLTLLDRVQEYFPGNGINYGLFYLDYKIAKDQLIQLFQSKLGQYRSLLVKEYNFASNKLQKSLSNLTAQISQKPANIYELVKQRQKLQMLETIILQFNESYEIYLHNLCEQNSCKLSKNDSERRWKNTRNIKIIYQLRITKKKEYDQIRKNIFEEVAKQIQQIDDILKLFEITLMNVKNNTGRQHYVDNFNKLEHLKEQYTFVKTQIQDIRYKQIHLQFKQHDFQLYQQLEQIFLTLYSLWESIYRWEVSKNIWYHQSFSQFEIDKPDKPENILAQIITNIKKIDKSVKQDFGPQLNSLIINAKKEVQFFQQNHLRLLKILKKKGFNKKHLQKIGIFIDGQIQGLTLDKAIQLDFLEKIDEIEAVSNDAWNEFYLEQTLERVFTQMMGMKYEIIYYNDKKNNEIPLLNNYTPMEDTLQQIILDLESVQFNPMKGQYQKRINDLLQKSLYVAKALESCQQFQKKLIQIHPIFDGTDVVKQLPFENKMFNKILRNWVELLKYMKRIVTVFDSCNGQNIHEKLVSMIAGIEKVKVGLANYMQKKRQGFNRFYLLTDQQLYQLFASTNDMNILSKHISKLFHAITGLQFDDQLINAVTSNHCSLTLFSKVPYKKQNLEQWLSHLERNIKNTVVNHMDRLRKMKKNWINNLNQECSQALLLCYQLQKTMEIQSMTNLSKIMQTEHHTIRKLVDLKKTKELTIQEAVNLGSLLVLSLYYSQKVNDLIVKNITDPNHFQMWKMMKVYWRQDQQITLKSFETEVVYGYQYLGLVKRLVLTNLTERMQLIYMSAIKYSLGGSAIGPAGTGKSQTTKDIARICGKSCIIYNCSQSLGIDIIIKILKGMVVTGMWICFDQFNRLNFQVLSMISEQLSIIFKYKAMRMKLEIQYDREVISFKPDFHMCVTYNPTYVGRQNIPKTVTKHFRTVAMVNCDKKMICKLLLYSKGFKEADYLSNKLTTIFEYCEALWSNFVLYDFGLRTLISIIELAGIAYKGQQEGAKEIIQSLRILVLPRLSLNHREVLMSMVKQQFGQDKITIKKVIHSQASRIRDILDVRLGIILLGDIFSGKTTAMNIFQQEYKDYRVEHIYINSLSVEQIYGETNPTTRLWKEGYLTKKIRQYFSQGKQQKMIIYIKGVIFSDWIENLNSVLDNSRSLSLSSGEIIFIPQNIKFLINCSHLDYASPATISRSCVISLHQKSLQQLINCDNERLRRQIIDNYHEVLEQIKKYIKYSLDERLLIHWVNKYSAKAKIPITKESFWHFLSLILQGMLQSQGRDILDHKMRVLFDIKSSFFSCFWDGKNWSSIKENYGLAIGNFVSDKMYVGDFIVKNQKYKTIQYFNRIFLQRYSSEDLFLLVGKQNTGKSSIVESIYREMDQRSYLFSKINATRRIKNAHIFTMIEGQLYKKSNKRKGLLQGKQLVILIDDINLPEVNKFQYKEIASFLTLLLQKKGCYNYNTLQFEHIEDIFLAANHSIRKNQLDFNKEFLKLCLPLFVSEYSSEDISAIFSQIIERYVTQIQFKPKYLNLSSKLIEIMKEISKIGDQIMPNYLAFQFIHYKNIVVNILLWNINDTINNHQLLIKNIFVFQTQRMLLTRLFQEKSYNNVNLIIKEKYRIKKQQNIILHSFEKTINGTVINPQKCYQVQQFRDFIREVENICDEYILSLDQTQPQSLVVFPQLCIILCRISRGLTLRNGNISLVGLPKCGKKVIIQLCNYLLRSRIYSTSDRCDQKSWYQTIRNATKQCFANKCQSILLLQHSQLRDVGEKEQMNILLKTSFLPIVYSQADYEELIYLFQSQLIKNRLATNKQNTTRLFIKYLKENMKIVILFNPAMKEFKEDIIYYPAITKYTEFYWIVQWPTEALLMIASQRIVAPELQTYLPIFVDIHQKCKAINAETKSKIQLWEGLYLDFLKTFNRLYDENKKQLSNSKQMLERSFNVIKQTENKLESTRDEIKRLQPAILLLQKQTIKTIKSLNIQKSNAQSANEQLTKKESQCARIIAEANIVKLRLETSNTKNEEELLKAWENVYLVKQNHIAEIKSLMNPSDLIKIVIAAIVIILNEGDIQIMKFRSQDGLSIQQNYFQTGKRFILSKDSKQITRMLTEYKKEKLTKQKIALIQEKCLNHPRWNIVQAKNANKAIFYFFLWVEAVVKYFKLFQETIPLREQLNKITLLVTQKNKEIEIVKKQLSIYESKIKQLSEAHRQKTQKLHQYTNKIILFQKMLNRGYQILKEIQMEKLKWDQYSLVIDSKCGQNMGNSILCSSLIIYTSPHTLENRNATMTEIKLILQAYNMGFNLHNIFWLMQNEEEIVLKELGIYHNQYILNNLKIIEKTNKMVFIIDPEEEGLKYLKNKYKMQGVLFIQKISYDHINFKKTLENSLMQGLVLFVQISGQQLPYYIQFLIEGQYKKNERNGNMQILFEDKYIPFNGKFKIYLFTTNFHDEFSISLISKVTTTNFAITQQQLQQKLINIIISVQFPQQNEELQELNKTNIKDNIQLKAIQSRILMIFANMTNCEDILKTEEILTILSTSNRLHKQIGLRVEDSNQKRSVLLARRETFRKNAHKISNLYFQIQELTHLSPLYQYSFNWFINIFQNNINSFTNVLSQQLSKGLPLSLKIIPSLLIAQNQFSKIPFNLLFSQELQVDSYILNRYNLKISRDRLIRIVGNIRRSRLQNLDHLIRDYPQKFDTMFTTPLQDIMSAIPNEFSSCQFFEKILLINCFRPDCTIKLLKDWLDINLGFTFSLQLPKVMNNTACNTPIIVYEHSESLISSVDDIYKLFDNLYKQSGKSICYINANNCDLQRIKMLIESGFLNDQWVVLEGMSESFQQLTNFILTFEQESDFKRKQIFRLWIIINEYELKHISQKLIKLSSKIVFDEEIDIIKRISAVFTAEKSKLQNFCASDQSGELNKKKYLLNELCVFHQLLNQKYKYKQKLWNQPIYFYQTDLQLNIKYLYFSQAEELKRLYPNIVTNIIYGGKITDQQDIETISIHIQQAIKNTFLDRNMFWQTVWADDKFPKSVQEHEHYLRTILNKQIFGFKNLYEQYGITSFVMNDIKQKQYKQISLFYNSTNKRYDKKDLILILKYKLSPLYAKISNIQSSKCDDANKTNPFHYYLDDQKLSYQKMIDFIIKQFKYYLHLEDIFKKKDEEWSLDIINCKVPTAWRIKTILSIDVWLQLFIEGYTHILRINQQDQCTDSSLVKQHSLKRIFSLQLSRNFATLCQNVMNLNNCTFQTHCLIWLTNKTDKVQTAIGIQVERWYLWNAHFQKDVKPLTQGTIEQYYYTLLPKGILTVVDNQSIKQLANLQFISVYQHSFEYGGSPNAIAKILIPVIKEADREWMKRMRVHITLTL